jgi:hypothetical protein
MVACERVARGEKSALYPSSDEGLTFGASLYSDGDTLLSIEISQSVPGRMC